MGTQDASQQQQQLNVVLICGGNTLERGISLNSARSLADCLSAANIVRPCCLVHIAVVRRQQGFQAWPVIHNSRPSLCAPLHPRPQKVDAPVYIDRSLAAHELPLVHIWSNT